jgi:hypothetical protein
MKVKITRATIAQKRQVYPGETLDVRQDEAIQLIGAGKAEAVKAEAETAQAPKAPSAEKPKGETAKAPGAEKPKGKKAETAKAPEGDAQDPEEEE